MTFVDDLSDGTLQILREIYGGSVTAAARDSEALSYKNGISGTSDYDKELRNGVALHPIIGSSRMGILLSILNLT